MKTRPQGAHRPSGCWAQPRLGDDDTPAAAPVSTTGVGAQAGHAAAAAGTVNFLGDIESAVRPAPWAR